MVKFITLIPLFFYFNSAKAQDTKAVAQALSDKVSILALGDPTHLEGTITTQRIELIKALHSEKHFSVIAFESNLFEMYYGYTQFLKDGASKHIYDGMYGIFPCQELNQLMDWVKVCNSKQDSIMIIGVESKFTGNNTLAHLKDFLTEEINSLDNILEDNLPLYYETLGTLIESSFYSRKIDDTEKQIIITETEKLLYHVESRKSDDFKTLVLKQTLINIIAEANRLHNSNSADKNNDRDFEMAKNVKFLHPLGKMVLWGSSTHYLKEPKAIQTHYFQKNNRITFGKLLKRDFPEAYFFIAYSSLEGKKTNLLFNSKVKPPKQGSIEFEAMQLKTPGKASYFMSLNPLNTLHLYTGEHQLDCRMLGHSYAEMEVSEVCDAIYFIDDTQPYTKLKAD
ncbi:erythromycin esterase family protein [Neptunitalea lumnitzerae]|uniref:Erythromycin esterase n=1 Tax=Neptunitalea lumnitzerae TaxID=2965509 RepID=A0ABQ5MEN6_9FLAO|nr:erythromycin esterase family protein [Neptunitalea sp. Y10]GLB47812.1 hypothetical protein Y10_01800 [Neptunitalea sp. Y10]